MYKGLALAALIAASATTAHAQGPRIEAHIGFDQQAITSIITDSSVGYTDSSAFKSDGLIYGGEIGYDVPIGDFQIGVYGGANLANTGECSEYGSGNALCIKAGRSFHAGVRVGYELAQGVLVYAKGGYSNGRVTTSYTDAANPANNGAVNDDFSGYHLGGGIQVDLSKSIYAKLEFVHTDHQDYVASSGTTTRTLRFNRDTYLYGMGLRF